MQGKTSFGLQSTAFLAIVVAAVVLLNLAGSNLAGRIDLTQDKIFTLSKASKKIVASLDDDVRVKVYFSPNLPAPYNNNYRYLVDQLEEYNAASRGRVRFEVFDPTDDPDVEAEAARYGVEPVQINVIENDQVEMRRVLMGVVVLYEDKSQVIPVLDNVADLEYRLTGAIRRLTREEKTVAGFLKGHGEPNLATKARLLRQVLQEDYEVRDIELSQDDPIAKDVKVLVLAGPTTALAPWEKFRVDQFIMGGGRMVFLIDRADADIQSQYAGLRDLELDDWTKAYGFKVGSDLIADAQSSVIQVAQRRGWMTIANVVKYPYFPEITRFDTDETLARDLRNLTLFFATPVEDASDAAGVTFVPLAKTSEHTALRKLPVTVSPFERIGRNEFNHDGVVAAAVLKGAFRTAFPEGAPPEIKSGTEALAKSPETRMVVVGDADFIKDDYSRDPNQLAFMLNTIDWLSDDTGLISIRSHGTVNRPLKEVSEDMRRLIKAGNLFAPALIVLIVGLVSWQARRRNRERASV